MRVTHYDPKTKKVLAILSLSPSPMAMPDITYLAGFLDDFGEMEIRQIVWRLITLNEVEMVSGTRFQPKSGLAKGSSKWQAVMNERAGVEEAQAKLKQVLIDLVSD